jgi:hypothetical protein
VSKLRRYTTISIGNNKTKNILSTWTQKRCLKCQRYLGKKNNRHNVCSECAKEYIKEHNKAWCKKYYKSRYGNLYYRTKAYVLWHIKELKIGDIIKTPLMS